MNKLLSVLLCLALLATFVPALGEEVPSPAETPEAEALVVERPTEEESDPPAEESPAEELPSTAGIDDAAENPEAEPAPTGDVPGERPPVEGAPEAEENPSEPGTPEDPEPSEGVDQEAPQVPADGPDSPEEASPEEESAPEEAEELRDEAASNQVDYDGLIVEDGVAINYYGDSDVVEIPNGVKEIGERCFYYSWVTEVKIPSSVTEISEEAFAWSSLERVTIPSSVRALMKRAFYECADLKTVNIQGCPGGIGDECFMYSGVENLTLNDDITYFGIRSFAYTHIKRLWLPENVEMLDKGAFQDIDNMTELYIPPNYQDSNKCLTLDLNKTNLTVYGYRGTFAETFAKGCKAFVALDSAPNLVSISASASVTPPKESVLFTAVTPKVATYLGLFAENGKLVKYWKASGNSTVQGNQRTWKVSYAIANTGNRVLTFKCSSGSKYGTGKQVKIQVTNSLPAVVSASAPSTALAKQPVTFTVKTPTGAKFLAMFAENGSKVKVWGMTGNSSVSGSYRVWKVKYAIANPGSRKLTFRCASSSSYGTGKAVSIQVSAAAPKVLFFDDDASGLAYPAVAQMCPQHWLVTTEPQAQYLRLYAGSTAVKTWKASECSYVDEDDGERYWQVQYRVNTGGTRNLTMKASADGTNYGAGYTQTFVYETPAKLTVGSTARGSLLEPYTYAYFSFCPSASGNFTFYSTGNVPLQATLYDDEYNIISYDGCYMHGSSADNFELTEGLSRSKNYFLEVELFGADAEGGTFRVGVR